MTIACLDRARRAPRCEDDVRPPRIVLPEDGCPYISVSAAPPEGGEQVRIGCCCCQRKLECHSVIIPRELAIGVPGVQP